MVNTDEKECWLPDLTASTASVGDACFTAIVMDTPSNDHMTKSDSASVPIRRNDHLVKVNHILLA